MSKEKTLALIKPDAIENGHQGKIINRILENGFEILAMKMLTLTKAQAEAFYIEHAERSFYGDLCNYMTSGSIIALALQKEGAIKAWRDLIGATDPADADDGTIRKDFAESKERNSAHGSDSGSSAHREVPFFFNRIEY